MSPLAYLLVTSFKNSMLRKVRRLREPRYVISMLAFLSYLSLLLFAGTKTDEPPSPNAEQLALARGASAAFLLLSAAGPWLLPGQSVALAFSMAEINLLFPAPLTRSSLLRHKWMAAQPAIAISALVFCFATRNATALRGWSVIGGAWLGLNALLLNRLLAQLSSIPLRPGARFRFAAIVGKTLHGLVAVAVLASLRWLPVEQIAAGQVGAAFTAWTASPVAKWALLPFATVAAPFVAQDPRSFALAAWPAALVLVGLYGLVVHRDVPFEEESLNASEKLKQRLDTFRRTGRLGGPGKVAPAPIQLRPRGSASLALAWKNYLSITRTPIWRHALYAVVALVLARALVTVPALQELHVAEPIAAMLGTFTVMLMLLGPDFVRHDLRTSLLGVDFLKTVPLPGWKIVLGEMLAPTAIVLALQATLLACALIIFAGAGKATTPQPLQTWLAGWLAATIFLGPVDLLFFSIANGAALLFPAWVPLGPRPQRGGEAFGMNLLLQFARLVIVAVGVLPAGFVAGVIGVVAWPWLRALGLPLAAIAGGFVVLVEVGGLVWLLGRAFERFDPSRESN